MCLCALGELFDIVAKKWNLQILEEIGKKKILRHKDLAAKYYQISPSTLSSSLRSLESIGFIKREVYEEIPLRVEYSISEKGQEILENLRPLVEWSKMNLGEDVKCRCHEKTNNSISETKNQKIKKIIEASLCACTCMAMMNAYHIFGTQII